jgi:hypothetical protein
MLSVAQLRSLTTTERDPVHRDHQQGVPCRLRGSGGIASVAREAHPARAGPAAPRHAASEHILSGERRPLSWGGPRRRRSNGWVSQPKRAGVRQLTAWIGGEGRLQHLKRPRPARIDYGTICELCTASSVMRFGSSQAFAFGCADPLRNTQRLGLTCKGHILPTACRFKQALGLVEREGQAS